VNKKSPKPHLVKWTALIAVLALSYVGLSTSQARGIKKLTSEQSCLCTQYGVTAPYFMTNQGEAEREAIRQRLTYLHGLGVRTVLQSFSTALIDAGREREWLIFLDEAHRLGMKVIVQIFPANDWDGENFDFTYHQAALAVVNGHPAVAGYYGLHEPVETFTGDQMRSFYATLKGFAPDMPILLDGAGQFLIAGPDRQFTDGICDLCVTWHFPFGWEAGEPIAEWDQVITMIQDTHALISASDPDAELWFRGQAFAQAFPTDRRMPTPAEMEELARIVFEGGLVDGFLWYPYIKSYIFDAALGDEEMESQRQAVLDIYETYCPPDLSGSSKQASADQVTIGQVLTYTLTISNSGAGDGMGTLVTDTWPAEVVYVPGSAWASSGVISDSAGITWMGTVTRSQVVTITAQMSVTAPPGSWIVNTASISHTTLSAPWLITDTTAIVNGPLATLVITPALLTLTTGTAHPFAAAAYDDLGYSMPSPAVTWSLLEPEAGSIDANGVFTAGWTTGTYTDTVMVASGAITDVASVVVLPPILAITPAQATLTMGTARQFTATAYDQQSVEIPSPPIAWSLAHPQAGAIGASGLFTAGWTAGTFTDTVIASAGNTTETASVTVLSPVLALTPAQVTLTMGTAQQFTATAYDHLGVEMPGLPVAWSLARPQAGAIGASGLFTAGWTAGTFTDTVVATTAGVTDTASVIVLPPVLALTPAQVTLTMGTAQQFTATAYDHLGAEMLGLPVAWSLAHPQAGAIGASGLFTAGWTAGTFTDTVIASVASITDTATVTVLPFRLYLPVVFCKWP